MSLKKPGADGLGEPYQVYSEITNTGKNLGGTKRKIRWLIGFTENSAEYEIVLMHSLVTGKKSIFEDNKEVVAAANIMASDFGHSWKSEATGRLYRIEASTGYTSEHVYTFSVDGLKFVDMKTKPVGVSTTSQAPKRVSHGQAANTAPTNQSRASFQSPAAPSRSSGNFDPFDQVPPAADEDAFRTADPFASTTTPTKPVVKPLKTPPGSTAVPRRTSSSGGGASTASFDAFSDAPVALASSSAAASAGFDPFSNDAFATGTSQTTSTDGFSNSDPFAATTTSSTVNTSTKPPTPSPVKVEVSKAASKPKGAVASNTPIAAPTNASADFMNDDFATAPPPAPENDDFSSVRPTSVRTSSTARRSSAAEISLDFAGLSYEPTQGNSQQQSGFSSHDPFASTAPAQEPTTVEDAQTSAPSTTDTWTNSDLVNLDLSGRGSAASARKKSVTATEGPSLASLMSSQPADTQRRSSMSAAPTPLASGFVQSQQPQQQPPLFGQTQLQPQFQAQQQPPQYGMNSQQQPPGMMGYSGAPTSIMQGTGNSQYAPSMGGSMGMGMPQQQPRVQQQRASISYPLPSSYPNQPTNSLDTLGGWDSK